MFKSMIDKYDKFRSDIKLKWDNFRISLGITTQKKIYKKEEIGAVEHSLAIILLKNPSRYGSPVIFHYLDVKIHCELVDTHRKFRVFTEKTFEAYTTKVKFADPSDDTGTKEIKLKFILHPYTLENLELLKSEKKKFARSIIIVVKTSMEDGFEGQKVVDSYTKYFLEMKEKN